jgi:hypothetical protein
MKSFIQFVEEIGTSGTGTSSVAGIGSDTSIGPLAGRPNQSEPGFTPAMMGRYQKRNKKGAKKVSSAIAMMVARNVPA